MTKKLSKLAKYLSNNHAQQETEQKVGMPSE